MRAAAAVWVAVLHIRELLLGGLSFPIDAVLLSLYLLGAQTSALPAARCLCHCRHGEEGVVPPGEGIPVAVFAVPHPHPLGGAAPAGGWRDARWAPRRRP